ncbi:MAG: 50S ribosomal protein L11 methyltransferase [Flavobacteriaceae bacterium]
MDYIECDFTVDPPEPWSEILLAYLNDLPFDSFELTEQGLKAFMPKEQFDSGLLENYPLKNHSEVVIGLQVTEHLKQNWNETWEKNFEPIVVGDQCLVRAEFHPPQNYPYELIITPKMSFGTGHHQTTQLMIQLMLEQKSSPSKVLDMGCGTGVLGILALKMGASHAHGIDIDDWCVENSRENAAHNNCSNFEVVQGNIARVQENYDWILANINRNVLMADLPTLKQHLNPGGVIFISGFLQSDWSEMQQWLADFGFKIIQHETKDNWMAAILQ